MPRIATNRRALIGVGMGIGFLYLILKPSRYTPAPNTNIETPGVNGAEQIFEYKVSYGGKYYVSSNLDFSGQGIKKIGDGKDHKRSLMTYLFTQNALDKALELFPSAVYTQTEY